jgi:hypothetical protein
MQTIAIERFLREQYSDEKLAALLAHAEDGKLAFGSCCCFIGVATAEHALQEDNYIQAWNTPLEDHLNRARKLPFARDAEDEFCDLGGNNRDRRQAIIPLIRAEIARRDSLKLTETAEPQAEAVTV